MPRSNLAHSQYPPHRPFPSPRWYRSCVSLVHCGDGIDQRCRRRRHDAPHHNPPPCTFTVPFPIYSHVRCGPDPMDVAAAGRRRHYHHHYHWSIGIVSLRSNAFSRWYELVWKPPCKPPFPPGTIPRQQQQRRQQRRRRRSCCVTLPWSSDEAFTPIVPDPPLPFCALNIMIRLIGGASRPPWNGDWMMYHYSMITLP